MNDIWGNQFNSNNGYNNNVSIIIDKQNSLKKKYQEKIKNIYKDDE